MALGQRHGVSAFELRALGGTIELPTYFSAAFGTPAALVEKVKRAGARIAALDTSFRVFDGAEADRAGLLEYVPWAEALGVPWLRVFDGGKTLDAASAACAADNLTWWQSLRRERGLKCDLMIETHDLLLDAKKIRQFVEAMPKGSVHLLWDAHHTWKRGGEDVVQTWKAVGSHVVHVHVKDSVSRPSEKHPFTYVLPGKGEFPMAALRDVLAPDFSGAVSLEWEKLWHPYLHPLDEALSAATANRWW